MSLILDALRRSDARRQALDLPKPPPPRRAGPRMHRSTWDGIAAILVAAGMVAVATAWWLAGDATPEASGPDQVTAPAGATSAEATPAANDERELEPIIPTVARDEGQGTGDTRPADASTVGVTSVGATSVANQDDPLTDRIPYLSELPIPFQARLQGLETQVHVWHQDAERRFIMVGGRRYREGDVLEAGPTLEAITRDGLILFWQGRRFQLSKS